MSNRSELFHRRAWSFRQMHDFHSAIADYTEALKIDPKCLHAIIGLADCYHCTSDFNKAIECYTRAIALDPNNAYALRLSTWG